MQFQNLFLLHVLPTTRVFTAGPSNLSVRGLPLAATFA